MHGSRPRGCQLSRADNDRKNADIGSECDDITEQKVLEEVAESVLQRLIAADENPDSDAPADPAVPPCLKLMHQARSDALIPGKMTAGETPANFATISDLRTDAHGRFDLEATPDSIGRFRIIRRLGHGAYGIVWLGLDPDLQRYAAVKVPRMLTMLDSKRRKRFLRESQATAALEHPHVATVYETGFDGELAYIASAYCGGGTLEDYLVSNHTLSTEVAARTAMTIAGAIAHAHQRGIVHRDLKPSNLFLQAEDDLKSEFTEPSSEQTQGAIGNPATLPERIQVADFGLATIQTELADVTATEGIVGTPAYMAPEQARGVSSVGPAADVYAIGVILYRMLTGRTPLIDDDPFVLLKKIAIGSFVRPQLLRSEVHRDLEAICLKCLALTPTDRYASAEDLQIDLQNFLLGKPVVARPYRFTDAWMSWIKREPAVTALAAFASLLLVAVIAGWIVAAGVFRKQRDDLRGQLNATLKANAETERLNAVLSRKLHEDTAGQIMRGLDEFIESGSANASHYNQRGEWAMNFGQYYKALSDFQRYQELAPENPYGYAHMAWLLACAPDNVMDPERALTMAIKARDTGNADHWSVLHCYGYALYANGNYSKALPVLTDAVEGASIGATSFIWTYRAMAEYQLGMHEAAKNSLAEAHKIREQRDEKSVFFDLNFERAQRLILGDDE